mmetsp:Transcript_12162/g.23379  ORF Transcript_12162/g.23379 Transcript_12162/m.23379 type:complete len:116 (+) Transcript_12162:156-503(+)
MVHDAGRWFPTLIRNITSASVKLTASILAMCRKIWSRVGRSQATAVNLWRTPRLSATHQATRLQDQVGQAAGQTAARDSVEAAAPEVAVLVAAGELVSSHHKDSCGEISGRGYCC